MTVKDLFPWLSHSERCIRILIDGQDRRSIQETEHSWILCYCSRILHTGGVHYRRNGFDDLQMSHDQRWWKSKGALSCLYELNCASRKLFIYFVPWNLASFVKDTSQTRSLATGNRRFACSGMKSECPVTFPSYYFFKVQNLKASHYFSEFRWFGSDDGHYCTNCHYCTNSLVCCAFKQPLGDCWVGFVVPLCIIVKEEDWSYFPSWLCKPDMMKTKEARGACSLLLASSPFNLKLTTNYYI